MKRTLLASALLSVLAVPAEAQQAVQVFTGSGQPQPVAGSNPLAVTCSAGCSGGGGAIFGSAFPLLGTAIGGTDGTNLQPLTVDASTHYLQVDVKAGAVTISGTLTPTSRTAVTSTSLEANHVITGAAGSLYSFEVQADSTLSAAAWWIMVYNATSAPGDGAVTPIKCYQMASGTLGASYAFPNPIAFSTGIVIGVSTTGCLTKTASAHAIISGDF